MSPNCLHVPFHPHTPGFQHQGLILPGFELSTNGIIHLCNSVSGFFLLSVTFEYFHPAYVATVPSFSGCELGFLDLSTTDVLERANLCCGELSCALQGVGSSIHDLDPLGAGSTPGCDCQKCLQRLRNVPGGEAAPLRTVGVSVPQLVPLVCRVATWPLPSVGLQS